MGKQEKKHQARKWDEITSEELYGNITSLQSNHNPELTLNVIEALHERMRDDIPVPYELLCYFLEPVFAQILEGKSADQAFGLKQTKGGYARPDTHDRDLRAAALIILRMRSGKTWLDAVADVSEILHVVEPTAARAYKKFSSLDCLPSEALEFFKR